MDNSNWLLQTVDLTKDFGGLRAIDKLSFGIAQGEVLGLIGPNGSGKSTCVNVITGVYKPTSGQIIYKGKPIGGLPPWKIAKMGILRTFQATKTFVNQTVLENVIFSCHVHEKSGVLDSVFRHGVVISERKRSEAKSMELLETTGLAQYARRPVVSIPPGAQRTLAIAMALAADPAVILLDEPAAGLSHEESEHLTKRVRDLAQRGMTVLTIDHHMKMMMHLCDRMVVIDHGNKIAEGKPREIAANQQVIEAYLGHRKAE